MELLPCPFCGAADKDLRVTKDEYGFFVRCLHCCVETDHHAVIKKAIAAWNSRANPASAPAGWKLVPGEPTEEILDVMFDAGIDRHDGDLTILYRAILAAAPTPPSTEDQKDAESTLEFICALEVRLIELVGELPSQALMHKLSSLRQRVTERKWELLRKAPAMQEDKP